MPNTVTLIEAKTISSTVSSITFSAIPNTYRDLRLISSTKSNTSGNFNQGILLTFNGDTGSNYNQQVMAGENAAGMDMSESNGRANVYILGAGASNDQNAANRSIVDVYIAQYAGSKKKSLISYNWSGGNDSGGSGEYNYVRILTGDWLNTAAISSITLTSVSGSFTAGNMSLYGIG